MKKPLLSILLFGAALALGCDKSNDVPKSEPAATGESTAAPAVEGASVDAVLGAYESIRALLARDETAGVAEKAGSLETAARGAAGRSSGHVGARLVALANAAGTLKGKAESLGEARKAFGEVSKQVVALISADPALQKGRHVFECPMAKGYKKWVQTKGEIENPYMGKEMLECGSESDWSA